MIPAGYSIIGDTEAIAVTNRPWTKVVWDMRNRPCECVRVPGATEGEWDVGIPPCPDCGGTGRGTFVIEVAPSGCGKCDPWSAHLDEGLYGETCASIGCTERIMYQKLRVHVVEVLEIGELAQMGTGPHIVAYEDSASVPVFDHWDGVNWKHDIALPAAAKRGMWAVRLAVHK